MCKPVPIPKELKKKLEDELRRILEREDLGFPTLKELEFELRER